jgi:hypothetical protein
MCGGLEYYYFGPYYLFIFRFTAIYTPLLYFINNVFQFISIVFYAAK